MQGTSQTYLYSNGHSVVFAVACRSCKSSILTWFQWPSNSCPCICGMESCWPGSHRIWILLEEFSVRTVNESYWFSSQGVLWSAKEYWSCWQQSYHLQCLELRWTSCSCYYLLRPVSGNLFGCGKIYYIDLKTFFLFYFDFDFVNINSMAMNFPLI